MAAKYLLAMFDYTAWQLILLSLKMKRKLEQDGSVNNQGGQHTNMPLGLELEPS